MNEHRLKILALARQALEAQGGSPVETKSLLKLLDILSASIEKFSSNSREKTEHLVQGLFDHRALLTMLKHQADELDALRKLSTHLTSSLDLPDVLDAITSEAMGLIANARDVNIYLYKNKKLTFGASLDSAGNRNKVLAKPRMNGVTYTVARNGEVVLIEDMRNHPLFVNAAPEWLGSIIGLPLKVSGAVVGVMNLSRTTVGSFDPAELQLLKLLSDQAAIAISNASLHQVMSRQAYSDTLTGLPNRRALDERLEEEVLLARKNDYSFAVIMMDLDGFKDVNDMYGHPVGDDVLRLVFSQMARGVRNTDFLARYGGDEFLVLLPEANIEIAKQVARRIQKNLLEYQEHVLSDLERLTASFGLLSFDLAEPPAQQRGERGQNPVAHRVPVAVVDVLEMIDVEE